MMRLVDNLEYQVKLEMYYNIGLEAAVTQIGKKVELLVRNKKKLQLNGRKALGTPADLIFRRNEPIYRNLFFLLQNEPKYLARLSILLREESQKGVFIKLIQAIFRGQKSGDAREDCLTLTLAL